MKKIVVLGGSFNPPTIGHYLLMKSAIKSVGADKGIFVPVSQYYVRKKMASKGLENQSMPDELRTSMLQIMCDKTPKFEIEHYELNTNRFISTFESLSHIQSKNPDAEIYFIVGSDKLSIIPNWINVEGLLENFKILVAARNGDDIEELLNDKELISRYRSSFSVFTTPDIISEISSTGIREMYGKGKGEAARQFLFNGTQDMFEEFAKKTYFSINDFHSEGYEFLSNFYDTPITFNGLTYQNVEAAFQAQKVLSDEERLAFTQIPAGKAKRLGRKVHLRGDWEFVKLNIMLEITRAKFLQNPELAEKLLATGNAMLVEGNRWNDTFWGVNIKNGKGENYLGRILMCVRNEIREEQVRKTI